LSHVSVHVCVCCASHTHCLVFRVTLSIFLSCALLRSLCFSPFVVIPLSLPLLLPLSLLLFLRLFRSFVHTLIVVNREAFPHLPRLEVNVSLVRQTRTHINKNTTMVTTNTHKHICNHGNTQPQKRTQRKPTHTDTHKHIDKQPHERTQTQTQTHTNTNTRTSTHTQTHTPSTHTHTNTYTKHTHTHKHIHQPHAQTPSQTQTHIGKCY